MDPATISAIATIGGSVFDFLSGRKQRRESPALAGKTAYQENYQGLLGRVEAGKALGLHPLAALGGSISSSGAPQIVGSDFRGAFSDIAQQAIQRREMQMRKEEYEFNKSQSMKAAEAADQQRAMQYSKDMQEIELNAKRGMLIDKEIQNYDRQYDLSQRELLLRQSMHTPGIVQTRKKGDDVPNMYVPVRDRYGRITHIPNPAIYDLELPDSVGAGTLLIPEVNSGSNLNWRGRLKNWFEAVKAAERERQAKERGWPHNIEGDPRF